MNIRLINGGKKIKHASTIVHVIMVLVLFTIFISNSYGETTEKTSYFTDYPPTIDGIITGGEWNNATKIDLIYTYFSNDIWQYGFLHAQNDESELYLLFDITDDTSKSTYSTNNIPEDYFLLSFDVNLDKLITRNTDVLFSQYPSNISDLGKSYYLSPGGTTGVYTTESYYATGFGSSINSQTPHRFWEFAINLKEIDADPHGKVRLGYRIHSEVPHFSVNFPANHTRDFSNLMEITLGATYQPENAIEPENPENPSVTFEITTTEGILIVSLALIVGLILILTLWTNKKNSKLQSRYEMYRKQLSGKRI